MSMENIKNQLNEFLSDDELLEALMVLPEYKKGLKSKTDRLMALLDIYKIFIPNKASIDIYNRLYLALINSLDKKESIFERTLMNDNFRSIKKLKRYGVIGGLDSFKITGHAGLGKTTCIQRCSEVITERSVLISDNPYREIIPFIIVECTADGSFKSLLYNILQEVDLRLGTSFFVSNKHNTTTVDVLLAAVSNVLINHVAVLIIDEIERVANESRKGEILINFLTQLVNQSNVTVVFVGNDSSNKYFESREYLSRRTLGVSITKMEYDESFFNFCRILFKYQYTLTHIDFYSEHARILYKLSNGSPSVLVSLFVEAQKRAIIYGNERLDELTFESTFSDIFSNMISYSNVGRNNKINTYEPKAIRDNKSLEITTSEISFENILKLTDKDISKMLSIMSEHIAIEYV